MGHNAIASLGDAGLLLALVGCAFVVGAGVAGARRKNLRLVRSSVFAAYATTGLIAFSSLVMWFALLSNDYSIKYVQQHSDASMPWIYKVTSFWGGLEGSIVWWVLLLSIFASLSLFINRERHKELIPYVAAILYVVIGFFLFLIIFQKRPFDVFLTQTPTSGKGLNPLLQNPYMATHPPSLYLGFVSATVPFAFGLAALITGNLDDSWLQSTRRWMIVSWYFLSQGLILGMLWAYEVLGWGGYWGWDPVENAGFLPWLTATAFLHSIIIQERRGMMKVWNVCLVITTFLLTMFGTFMTRSGIVQSVHAFGQDTTLAWLFSTFIGAIAIFSFGYVIYRLPLLRSRNELDSWLSREYAFLLNNWILLGAALFILTATLFPTLSEWIAHDRITVGPPFFNTTMTPVGLTLLFLTGVGPLIAWRKASAENLKTQFALPTGAMVLTALVLGIFTPLRGWSEWTVRGAHLKFPLTASVMCFSLCAFVITTISQEFYRGTRVRQSHTKLDFFTSLIGLVARGKRRYGGYLVHVAIVLMFVGFAGDAYKVEKDFILDKGQQVQVGSTKYTLRYTGVNTSTAPDKDTLAATIEVQKDGKPYVTMYPAKWSFRHHEDEPPTTDVAIHKTLAEDLYIVLNGYDSKSQSVSIKTVINPLVNWIWLGFLLLIFGTVIAFLPDRALALAGAAAKSDKTKAAAAATAILFLLMSPATVHAQSQMAQVQQGSMLHMARNDHERMLFNKYRCLCGTCAHSLDECAADGCGEGEMRRVEIQQLLDRGMSDDDIYKLEIGKYGEETLRVPLDKGYRRMVWVLPVAALFGAAGLLVAIARRTRNKTAPSVPTVGAPGAAEDEYQSRLDDELDELD
ncbi:MAG TPA: cytochrome c-type biogenesis CcmF C-terminal domain-containing protein [Polyangia bacterium]|nr:cytochrome c-type biogenesis CcmF C-terminal domain-containing protein [Polyangia bacterium]